MWSHVTQLLVTCRKLTPHVTDSDSDTDSLLRPRTDDMELDLVTTLKTGSPAAIPDSKNKTLTLHNPVDNDYDPNL